MVVEEIGVIVEVGRWKEIKFDGFGVSEEGEDMVFG